MGIGIQREVRQTLQVKGRALDECERYHGRTTIECEIVVVVIVVADYEGDDAEGESVAKGRRQRRRRLRPRPRPRRPRRCARNRQQRGVNDNSVVEELTIRLAVSAAGGIDGTPEEDFSKQPTEH